MATALKSKFKQSYVPDFLSHVKYHLVMYYSI